MSRQFEGEICPFCHSPVEYKDADINITGWISLGKNNRVINPYYYELLIKALGNKVFTDIINAKYKITVNGLKKTQNTSSTSIFKEIPLWHIKEITSLKI